jgi:hypothetical protein
MVKTDTSMPDVNFGQANQSIVTGKAINELQGAGTGSLVEMVQGVGIGKALVAWNEKAITSGAPCSRRHDPPLRHRRRPRSPRSTRARSP